MSTGTSDLTMAELTRTAAERYGDAKAAMFLRDGEWAELSFNELWEQVRDLAFGLIGLGVDVGDRVCILANTRIEFTVADLAVSTLGAIVVPVYPSNSPDECAWVVGNSGAEVIVCEDAAQVAKIDKVRSELPELAHVLIIDGAADGAVSMAEIAGRGAGGDDAELERRAAAVGPEDACLIIYTSGTTGRPKGVVLTNKGFAAGARLGDRDEPLRPGRRRLPLPPARPRVRPADPGRLRRGRRRRSPTGAATRCRSSASSARSTRPCCRPCRASSRRCTRWPWAWSRPVARRMPRRRSPSASRCARRAERGEEVSAEEAAEFERIDSEMFALVRGIFGGRITMAISGAAPIAPEILEFFYAAGVPVFEGWGMTETTSIGTLNLPGDYKFGTIGKPIAGADVRIAEDGEIEMAGTMIMREYWRNPEATAEVMTDDGYLRTGDVGSIDEDGFVTITGRKKDIIITAGGKNLTPANLEGDLRRSRWVSQAVMFADRKPYPVALITLDAEVVVPWAQANGLPAELAELAEHPDVRQLIQADLDEANARYARVEQIKKFKILERDFSLESGELTPSLKLKRNVVYANYADDFEGLYKD